MFSHNIWIVSAAGCKNPHIKEYDVILKCQTCSSKWRKWGNLCLTWADCIIWECLETGDTMRSKLLVSSCVLASLGACTFLEDHSRAQIFHEHNICHPPVVGGDDSEKRRGMAHTSGLDDRRVVTDREARLEIWNIVAFNELFWPHCITLTPQTLTKVSHYLMHTA